MSTERGAIVLGSTGLVGGHVLSLLARDPAFVRVVAPVRRATPGGVPTSKLTTPVVDFDAIGGPSWKGITGTDLFCCLGTTIDKAGSKEAFRKVDFTAVVESARWARGVGVERLLLVSAIGANARSSVFYSRVKGEAEDAVSRIGFASVHVFRPSFLTGDRKESRPGERVGILVATALSPFLVSGLRKYRPIPAASVARAMVRMALEGQPGVHVHEYDELETG